MCDGRIQLTVNVQIPKGFGGVAGEAFFIGTLSNWVVALVSLVVPVFEGGEIFGCRHRRELHDRTGSSDGKVIGCLSAPQSKGSICCSNNSATPNILSTLIFAGN